jgi:hypothetical protein
LFTSTHSQYVRRPCWPHTRATPAAGVRRPSFSSSSKSPSRACALRDRLCGAWTPPWSARPRPMRRRPVLFRSTAGDLHPSVHHRTAGRALRGMHGGGVDPTGWHTWPAVDLSCGARTRVRSERVDRARRFDRRNRLPPVWVPVVADADSPHRRVRPCTVPSYSYS